MFFTISFDLQHMILYMYCTNDLTNLRLDIYVAYNIFTAAVADILIEKPLFIFLLI